MRRAVLLRFARGLGAAVGAAGIAYGLNELPELEAVIPGYVFVAPVITAGLLAADKWVRSRSS